MRLNLLRVCLGNRVFRLLRPHLTMLNQRRYWHIRQGGKVLLVAHIDTVCKPRFRGIYRGRLYAAGLDDRLGVCLALGLAAERHDVDVLITDEEEAGRSTAALVEPRDLQAYNLVLGLDRGGMDFVDYGLAGEDLIMAYEQYAPYEVGSFSDICFLRDPPCGCLNIGIGYERAHEECSYVRIADIRKTRNNLRAFLDQHATTRFPAPKVSEDDCRWWDSGFDVFPRERVCLCCRAELEQWEGELCAGCAVNMGRGGWA